MSSKYLLILLPLVFGNLPVCDKYLNNLTDGECSSAEVNRTEMIFHLKKCKKDQYCSYLFPLTSNRSSGEAEKCSNESPKKYIGEYCTNDKECQSSECNLVRKTCASSKSKCEEHGDCDIGLYCSTDKKCAELEDKGKKCSETKKCKVKLICNNEICTEVGSVAKLGDASAPAACETFYIADKKCQEGPKLENGSRVCSENNDKCIYKNYEGKLIEEKCQCGMTAEGKSYCSPGIGDMDIGPVFFNINY